MCCQRSLTLLFGTKRAVIDTAYIAGSGHRSKISLSLSAQKTSIIPPCWGRHGVDDIPPLLATSHASFSRLALTTEQVCTFRAFAYKEPLALSYTGMFGAKTNHAPQQASYVNY